MHKSVKNKREQKQKPHFLYHHPEIITVNILAYIYIPLLTCVAIIMCIP